MACHNYQDRYGTFPPAYVADENGRPLHSWRVLLLPFIDEVALYDRYDFSEPWDGPNNRQLVSQMPNSYVFPGESPGHSGVTNYLAVVDPETVWPGSVGKNFYDIADASNTIMIVENRGSKICWMEPRDLELAGMSFDLSADPPNGLSSKFKRIGVAMADGRLRGLTREIDPSLLRALLTDTYRDELKPDSIIEWPNSRDLEEL